MLGLLAKMVNRKNGWITQNRPHFLLTENYAFRRNILNSKVEFAQKAEGDDAQLYAQVLHELRNEQAPYWFNNEEVARIQQLNQNYQEKKDLAEMITACFRKAKEGEDVKPINGTRVLEILQNDYTTLKITQGAKVNLGKAMRELGVETCGRGNVAHYRVVPLRLSDESPLVGIR